MMSDAPASSPPRIDKDAVREAAGPELEALQAEVSDAIKTLMRRAALGFLIPSVVILSGFIFGMDSFRIGAFLGAAAMTLFWLFLALRAAARIFAARSRVLEAVAPALNLTYAARPETPIDLSAFEGTYYASVFKHSRVEDVLSGAHEGAAFEMFDVKLRARSKGPDGKWRASEPPPFLREMVFAQTGVVRIPVPGRWTGRTVVLRDAGIVNRLNAPRGLARVRLVDPEFEKVFEVFSDDQVEARTLLDPVVMERLKRLEDIFAPEPVADDDSSPAPAVGVFQDGHLLIALPRQRPEKRMDIKSFADLNADFALDMLIAELEAVYAVVDALAKRRA